MLDFILIFFYNLSSIDNNNWITFTTIFLIAFVFFQSLGLKITYNSNKKTMSKLSLIFILMLLIGFIFIVLSWFLAF